MNTAAVNAWEQKLLSNHKSISDKPKRQRRRRRRLGVDRDCTTSDTAVEIQRPQLEHISETPPHKSNSSISPNHNSGRSGISGPTSSHSPLNPPHIIVQVSQHSSFDKDLYIAYQSSLSTQGTSSLLSIHTQLGLEGSSPPPSTHSPADSNDIIPDSQSLPGSPSYRPTSSASLAVLGADHTPLDARHRVLHNNTDIKSSTGGVAEAKDSIEDSSAVVIEASQPSVIASERSRSEPAPSITGSSSASSFGAQLRSLARSTSDPTPTYHDLHQRQALVSKDLCAHSVAQDQVIEGLADFQSPHQLRAASTQQRQRSSKVQVPGSIDRSSRQSYTIDDSPVHSLVFQTQVPLAFASQGSRVSLTPAGESSGEPADLG